MSILTKVFVVLLVVLVLVFTSGTIVFINKIEPFEAKVKTLTEAASRERAGRLAAEQEAAAARGDRDLRVLEADARAVVLRGSNEAFAQQAKTAVAAVAAANAERDKAVAEAAATNQAVQGSVTTIDTQQKTINDQATKLAAAEKDRAELQVRVAKFVQDVDGRNATIRKLREEIAALNEKIDEFSKSRTVIQAGANNAAAAPGAAVNPGAFLNLRGVIKAKRNINGTEYATISLGSSSNVQKGMEFKVIDGGNFLGYLTIDSVETDESVGHLSGPNLASVRPGVQVRTQY